MKKKYKNIKLIVYKRKRDKEQKKPPTKNYLRSNLVELYKAQQMQYNKTRELQWKFNVSIWAIIFIAKFFKHLDPEVFNRPLLVILFITALLGHYVFVYITQRSLAGSRRIMNDYLLYLNSYHKIENIIIKIQKYDRVYVLTLTDYLWIAFQIIITFFILLIFIQV